MLYDDDDDDDDDDENDWLDVGRPLSCNAFAIARFLVVIDADL